MIINRDNFNNQEKKLKRYIPEKRTYDMIINHIKLCNSFEELQYSPIAAMYGFEALKYELSGYYSFRLSKKGGLIRLIVSKGKNYDELNLEYISMDHYEDFKRRI